MSIKYYFIIIYYLEQVRDPKVGPTVESHLCIGLGCRADCPSHWRGQKRRLVRDSLSLTWIILGFVCSIAELNVKVDVEDGVVVVIPWDWGARREAQD